MNPVTDPRVPPWAWRLGVAGLIPFVVLAGAAWLPDALRRDAFSFMLVAYGATIASFLGAIHWGLAMRDALDAPAETSAGVYVWGITPALVAWVALLLPAFAALLTLAVLIWVCYGVDKRLYPRRQAAHWLRMRLWLTTVASASCLVGAAAWWR